MTCSEELAPKLFNCVVRPTQCMANLCRRGPNAAGQLIPDYPLDGGLAGTASRCFWPFTVERKSAGNARPFSASCARPFAGDLGNRPGRVILRNDRRRSKNW